MIRIAPLVLITVVLAGGCAASSKSIENFAVVSVQGKTRNGSHDYEAYISPPIGSSDPVPGFVDLALCQIRLNSQGWTYLWGSYPAALGTRVRVVGIGTRFILETTATADRVYFIPQWGDHALTLYRIDASGNETLLPVAPAFEEAFYVQIDDTVAAPTAQAIQGSAFEGFVRDVKDRVWSYDWPLGWPSW